jgi:plastocyanin domain-containing protein
MGMTAKIVVTLAGLGLIAFVNWYFFPGPQKKA